jgi:hypothetical protein
MEFDKSMFAFSPAELQLLQEHVKEQKRIRKFSTKDKSKEEVDKEILVIAEQIHFHNLDFIMKNKFFEDKEKLHSVWQYLVAHLN